MLSVIVLAAGSSSRMEQGNKLLLPYKGKPLLTHVVENILAAGIGETIVVTGHEAPLAGDALRGLPVTILYNPRHGEGMTGSIQTGVQAAAGDGYMICLSDMALISAGEYALLANAFRLQHAQNRHCICLPEYKGIKGNPVIFSAVYRDAILRHRAPEGCKDIVRAHPENIHLIDMPSDSILKDIDCLADYNRLTRDR